MNITDIFWLLLIFKTFSLTKQEPQEEEGGIENKQKVKEIATEFGLLIVKILRRNAIGVNNNMYYYDEDSKTCIIASEVELNGLNNCIYDINVSQERSEVTINFTFKRLEIKYGKITEVSTMWGFKQNEHQSHPIKYINADLVFSYSYDSHRVNDCTYKFRNFQQLLPEKQGIDISFQKRLPEGNTFLSKIDRFYQRLRKRNQISKVLSYEMISYYAESIRERLIMLLENVLKGPIEKNTRKGTSEAICVHEPFKISTETPKKPPLFDSYCNGVQRLYGPLNVDEMKRFNV